VGALQELSRELDYSQREFSTPALGMLKRVREQMALVLNDVNALRPLVLCARLLCRIFFSLNALGLSEVVEEQLKEWMAEFHALLQINTAVLDETDPEKESALDAVKVRTPNSPHDALLPSLVRFNLNVSPPVRLFFWQAAVCENINLYMEKCEEEFQSYLGTFVQVVWELLLKVWRTLPPIVEVSGTQFEVHCNCSGWR
jgi:exportin-2 (importin alpha re-exporter)